jgi:hypothetical protein
MEPHVLLRELWQPILLSTVLCFFAGFVLHMLLPLHKADFTGLPGESGVVDALRKAGVGAGQYMIPWCDPKDMKSPDFQQKWATGPTGILVIRRPGKLSMAPMLTWMVVYHLVVSCFVAYLVNRTQVRGTDYLHVFRVAGTAAIMGYGFGFAPHAIWYGFKTSFTVKSFVDAVVWGLLTAGTFGWLWPR